MADGQRIPAKEVVRLLPITIHGIQLEVRVQLEVREHWRKKLSLMYLVNSCSPMTLREKAVRLLFPYLVNS